MMSLHSLVFSTMFANMRIYDPLVTYCVTQHCLTVLFDGVTFPVRIETFIPLLTIVVPFIFSFTFWGFPILLLLNFPTHFTRSIVTILCVTLFVKFRVRLLLITFVTPFHKIPSNINKPATRTGNYLKTYFKSNTSRMECPVV